MKQLTKQEIHQLAMQEVGDYLKSEGYEFLAVNSQMKRSPQFVCVKEKSYFLSLCKVHYTQRHQLLLIGI